MPGRYFALLACLTIMIMAGCGMNKSEKTINKKLNKLKPDEIANVEFAYITKELFRIDAPPLRRKVSSSNYSSLCDALRKARAESKMQMELARLNPLTLEIQVKEGVEEKMIILFVDNWDFFELREPSDNGEKYGVRFFCRDLMVWAARYQADMDMEFLAYLGEVQPDFRVGAFSDLISRLKKALPFYDFSGDAYGKEALFAKDFAEWYKNSKDKLVWDDKAKHYVIGN